VPATSRCRSSLDVIATTWTARERQGIESETHFRRAEPGSRSAPAQLLAHALVAAIATGLRALGYGLRACAASGGALFAPPARGGSLLPICGLRATGSRLRASDLWGLRDGSWVGAEREPCGARRSAAARKCVGARTPRRSAGNKSVPAISRCRSSLDGVATTRTAARATGHRVGDAFSGVRNPALDLRQHNCLPTRSWRQFATKLQAPGYGSGLTALGYGLARRAGAPSSRHPLGAGAGGNSISARTEPDEPRIPRRRANDRRTIRQ
jgi:hypothetical protein